MVCILALLLVLITLSFTIADKSNQKCSQELEKVISKPAVCGKSYFEELQRDFVTSFPPMMDPLKVSEYCLKFSLKKDVTMNILNQQGVDMCSFRTPTAVVYMELFSQLNLRNPWDRYYFYNNISTTLPNFDIPPIMPYFDVWGIFKMYYKIVVTPNSTILYENIQELMYNITHYPNSGYQGVPVLNYQYTISQITASFTATWQEYNAILTSLNCLNIPEDNPLTFISFYLFTLFYGAAFNNAFEYIPIETIYKNMDKQQIFLLNYLGTFGIIKNQASPLPINAIQDGFCYWAFNTFYQYGFLYKIIFSQPKQKILYPKKK